MPLNLSVAFDPGDLDPGKSYTHVKIVSTDHNSEAKTIRVVVARGYMSEGEFVESTIAKRQLHTVQNVEGDLAYDTVVSNSAPNVETSDPEDSLRYAAAGAVWVEKTYYAVKRALYEWLEDKGFYAGTIE